jgi:hypothetical protein
MICGQESTPAAVPAGKVLALPSSKNMYGLKEAATDEIGLLAFGVSCSKGLVAS